MHLLTWLYISLYNLDYKKIGKEKLTDNKHLNNHDNFVLIFYVGGFYFPGRFQGFPTG